MCPKSVPHFLAASKDINVSSIAMSSLKKVSLTTCPFLTEPECMLFNDEEDCRKYGCSIRDCLPAGSSSRGEGLGGMWPGRHGLATLQR